MQKKIKWRTQIGLTDQDILNFQSLTRLLSQNELVFCGHGHGHAWARTWARTHFFISPFVQFSGANNLKSFSHCVFWLLSSKINLSFLRSKNLLPKKFKTPFPISFISFQDPSSSLIGRVFDQWELWKLSSTNWEPIITKISWIAKSDEHPPSSQPCHLKRFPSRPVIGQSTSQSELSYLNPPPSSLQSLMM